MPESRPGGADAARAEQGGNPTNAKAEPDPLIGRVINGRFKIVSVIARGGMGKVYKAEQSPLGRICALKVLSPKYEGDRDPEFHKRFFLEASTAARLTHANTVTVFDYGQSEDDIYYIAMEYIEGRTLHRVLREEGQLSELRVAHVASQICRSLREAHSLGVVHRDLKPGNILLSDRGDERDSVKVLDFGLVKDVTGESEDLTQAGLFMGSPKYMAPEQILGGEITARTDIYSLGVMMYEMLSGKVPFDRGASVGTLMAHVNDVPPPMQETFARIVVSPSMEQVVFRCLEKEPSRRYGSMKELLNALKRVEGGAGTMSETNEGLPVGRTDPGAASARSPDSAVASTAMGSSPPPDSRIPSPSITDSLTGPAPAPPADTDAMTPARPKSRVLVWAAAAAVAAAIVIAVAVTSKQSPAGEPHAASDQAVAPARAAEPPPSAVVAVQAPVATATTPPPRAIHIVRVDSEPAGATVSDNGVEVCTTTPCNVTWAGAAATIDHKLTLAKKGYRQTQLDIATGAEKAATKLEIIPYVAPKIDKPSGDYKPSPY